MLLWGLWIENVDFFQNNCYKELSNMAVVPTLWITIDLFKKYCLPVITWNKKRLSKQVVSIICTPGKDFFAAPFFKGL